MSPDLLFAPPTVEWSRQSPKYAKLRILSVLLGWLPLLIAGGIATVVLAPLWLLAPVIVVWLALVFWRCLRVVKLQQHFGYAELTDDLYVTRGLLYRRLTAVPFGRMQAVEVVSGPLERAFGLATVRLVTASASTDAVLPGLPPDEAARLRDRLTELAETRPSGL